MSLTDLLHQLCCRRRAGGSSHGSSGPDPRERRLAALRTLERKRREIYERRRPQPMMPSSVEDLGSGRFTVQSRSSKGPKGKVEALATPPCMLSVELPKDYVPGQPAFAEGPHGRLQVDLPPEAKPGMKHCLRLGPSPEFRIGVPKGARPGTQLKFQRADGVEVLVTVPEGMGPGDTLEVPPPVLMVQVPTAANPGDYVFFRRSGGPNGDKHDEEEWCKAQVPEGLKPGKYFAARLPAPKGVATTASKVPAPSLAAGAKGKGAGTGGLKQRPKAVKAGPAAAGG